jgi:catechol 2,3-dioxygenase-like lactoylglutathione lyase family enzyme
MPELHFNHVARRTKNLEASRKFYEDVLGCRIISRPAFSFRGYWMYLAGMQFHLIEDPNTPDAPAAIDTQQNHVAFSTDDPEAMERRLRDLGIPYRRQIIPDRQIHQLFFLDPDGWMIEVGWDYSPIDS